jgi:hypothetical protein
MLQAIADRELGVVLSLWTIQRLQKEVAKVELLEAFRFRSLLGEDQLEFMTSAQPEFRSSFGTDADPIDAPRWQHRAVGFDRHDKTSVVQGGDEHLIELQEWLTTCADDQGRTARSQSGRPCRGNGGGKSTRRLEASPTRTIDTDEISVAEPADGRETILLTT